MLALSKCLVAAAPKIRAQKFLPAARVKWEDQTVQTVFLDPSLFGKCQAIDGWYIDMAAGSVDAESLEPSTLEEIEQRAIEAQCLFFKREL